MADDGLNDRIDAVIKAGRAEFPDFDSRASYLVALGHQPDLRQATAGLGNDAHRVLARLADDPDQAERIMAKRGTALGLELGRYAGTRKAAAPPPEPPKPAAPKAPDITDPSLPMTDYAATRAAQIKARQERQPKAKHIGDPSISMDDYALLRAKQDADRRKARRGR